VTDEEKQAAQAEQARAVAGWIERLHWPQVFLFATFLVCSAALPIGFLTLVPEHTQDKFFSLPWSTILGVGLPMLGMAIHGFIAPFMRPMVANKEPDSKSPSTGTTTATATVRVTRVPHVSPPVEERDPDTTPRGPFRGGASREQRPTDPDPSRETSLADEIEPETKP
jgi:hypothetical protein